MKLFFLLFCLHPLLLFSNEIVQTPIPFSQKRVELTKEYIKDHYKKNIKTIKIIPKIILIHHTQIDDFEDSLSRFVPEVLPSYRHDIIDLKASVNVSSHFMVEPDGTIHQLMPLDFMARHVIGLNYNSIGIENVGGENLADNLTNKQLEANIFLVKYLMKKFETIEYLVAHYEYRCFEGHSLWLEVDDGYRTKKNDPSQRFMQELRKNSFGLKSPPCDDLKE